MNSTTKSEQEQTMTQTLIKKLDLQTGHEIRAAVMILNEQGLPPQTIANALGLTETNVRRYIRLPRPRRARYTVDALNNQKVVCTICNAPAHRNTIKKVWEENREHDHVCADCNRALYQTGKTMNKNRLKVYANQTGLVPTVDRASAITGLGRSDAGLLVNEVFGADSRNGYERHTPRPYILSAPPVPIR